MTQTQKIQMKWLCPWQFECMSERERERERRALMSGFFVFVCLRIRISAYRAITTIIHDLKQKQQSKLSEKYKRANNHKQLIKSYSTWTPLCRLMTPLNNKAVNESGSNRWFINTSKIKIVTKIVCDTKTKVQPICLVCLLLPTYPDMKQVKNILGSHRVLVC